MSAGLHVEAAGHGPPLVLLHGWAMHSGVWGGLPAALARGHRVHAVDLPGHGRSPSHAPFTAAAVVRSLDAAFEAERHPVSVVGWSLGGQLALAWALTRPGRIARLVLVGTTPRFVAGEGWTCALSHETLARFGDELHVSWRRTVSAAPAGRSMPSTVHSRLKPLVSRAEVCTERLRARVCLRLSLAAG